MEFFMTSPTKKMDARIAKTLASIESAFLQILTQKAYDDITITDILEKALINRTTFYKYYNNKNDLTHQLIENLANEFFIPLLNKRYSVSWDEFSRYAPEVFAQNQAKLRILWHIQTPKTTLKKHCYELVKQKYLEHMANCDNIHPDESLDFQAHILASVSLACMEQLIYSDQLPSPESTHRDLERVMNNLLHRCPNA